MTYERDDEDHQCISECTVVCFCGRGTYRECKYRSCYECYLDRLGDYRECIICGRWHSPDFDTCFQCRPLTRGRDDAAKALRQLILWRDEYECRYCGAVEGEMQVDPRLVRSRCPTTCAFKHPHRMSDDDGLRHTLLHVDHIIPCARGGKADEWNLQVLCHVCNIAKGATWYPGCRHETVRTDLARVYFLISRSYFGPEDRERFLKEVHAWRAVKTWDPVTHGAWWREKSAVV